MKEKKILILANHDLWLYKLRKELIQRLLAEGYAVYLSSPEGSFIERMISLGCCYIKTNYNRHSINFIAELSLLLHYIKIIHQVHPIAVLTYTIKPNIYGGIACKIKKVPYIANITGLGGTFNNHSFMEKAIIKLYKYALSRANVIFFQNKSNMKLFVDNGFDDSKFKLISGSGVNLDEYNLLPYPSERTIEFVFIGRVMKDKGIEEFLSAAEYIVGHYSNVKFHICGFCEESYDQILKKFENQNIIKYHGLVEDIKNILSITHCTILPSYHEGMSNTLLESAACGRPVLASDIPGCREIVEDGVNGYLFKPRDSQSLIEAIEKFCQVPYPKRIIMGIKGRKKCNIEFDRNKVVTAYIKAIKCMEN